MGPNPKISFLILRHYPYVSRLDFVRLVALGTLMSADYRYRLHKRSWVGGARNRKSQNRE